MFYDDDLPVFLKDFGKTAILEGGGEATVIFDNEYAAATLLGQDVASSQPMVIGLTSDLGELAMGDTIEIDETTYMISDPPQSDGQGMTTLLLKI